MEDILENSGDKIVIIVAYSCSPMGLSEQWLGWKWVEMAAKRAKVHLITRPDRDGLKEVCFENNVELHEVPVPPWTRKFTQKLGDPGMWMRVHAWAKSVREKVRELDSSYDVDYGHLVTFHSVRMPSVFDECDFIKVWGPASGLEYVPDQYFPWVGRERSQESFRNKLAAVVQKRLIKKAKQFDVILFGNSQTMKAVEAQRKGVNRVVLPNNAVPKDEYLERRWKKEEPLKLVFVGSCQGRRGIPLLLEALKRTEGLNWQMDIAGTGPALDFWKEYVAKSGLGERVRFHGWVDKSVVNGLYDQCHLFAFPSVRDGGGSGMLEALERGVPVLALDWGGPADVIGNSGAGALFPVSTPEETIGSMCRWFSRLLEEETIYEDLLASARDFDLERFSWSYKQKQLDSALAEVKVVNFSSNS